LFHATLKALVFLLQIIIDAQSGGLARPSKIRDLYRLLAPQVFKVHFLRHPVKVKGRIARILRNYFRYLGGYSINRFVSQVVCFDTATTSEQLYQPSANLFILDSGSFGLSIQPAKQTIKSFLS
jgi:hypothetical protein